MARHGTRRVAMTHRPTTLWDGLVEYLPLSESSAGSAPVERAGLHLGTRWTDATNVPSGTGLVYPTCGDFTLADGDYLSHIDYRLHFTGSFTVAAWVRSTGADAVYRGIVYAMGTNIDYALFINQSAQLVSNIGKNLGGAGETNLHNSALAADTWYLVRMWFDADNDVHCNQINLGAIASEAQTASYPSYFTTNQIGRYANDKPWSGQIGPVMWWDRVLTAAEWSELYHLGYGVQYSGHGGGPEWQPTDIAGCQLWLDAHDLDGTGGVNHGVASGAKVATWVDKSRNGRNMTQATEGSKPTYTYNGTVLVGSNTYRPVVQFAGGTHLSSTTLLTGTSGTVIAAFNISSLTGFQALLSAADEADADHYVSMSPYFHATGPKVAVMQKNGDTTDWVLGSTETLAATPYIMVWQSSGTAYALRVNGTDQTESAASGTNSGDWWDDVTGVDNITVGATKKNSVTDVLTAYVGEVIVYDSALSAAQLARVEAYLAAKWGITLA